MAEVSPMMQHYLQTKEQYKDCILFYRLGDFYEMFFDDAIMVSKELELTLTGKNSILMKNAVQLLSIWQSLMRSSMRSLQAGRPIVWQRLIWQLSDWQFMR